MKKIKEFFKDWTERGYEKGEAQVFWLSFLRDVNICFNVNQRFRFSVGNVPIV